MKMKKITIKKIAISTKTEGEIGGILIPMETEMMIGIAIYVELFEKLSLFSQTIFTK